MTVVGITGHRTLSDRPGLRAELDAALAELDDPLIGISALAAGADQVFAGAILEAGGILEVIVPSADYRSSLDPPVRDSFDRFVDAASTVTTLDHPRAGRGAYLDAGLAMLDRCDLLYAVWDGAPSRGIGGTADLVRRARDRGIPVRVFDVER